MYILLHSISPGSQCQVTSPEKKLDFILNNIFILVTTLKFFFAIFLFAVVPEAISLQYLLNLKIIVFEEPLA